MMIRRLAAYRIKPNRAVPAGLLVLAALLGGCLPASDSGEPTTQTPRLILTHTPAPSPSMGKPPASPAFMPEAGHPVVTESFTYQNANGNRLFSGRGNLPESKPLDLALSGTPAWVLGANTSTGIIWVVALEDGRLEAFQGSGRNYSKIPFAPGQLDPGTPFSLISGGGWPSVLEVQTQGGSPLSHPVFLPGSDSKVIISQGGDLVFESQTGEILAQIPASALTEARVLRGDQDRLLFLSSPTSRYPHGVLGDGIEAAGITLVETRPQPGIVRQIDIPPPDVIEGISPLWVDLDGDGNREIIVTTSNASQGSQLRVYGESGDLIASSQPIGAGFRWRHQIAAGPFGPAGEMEVVAVRTPHIDGVVEYYQLHGDQLVQVAAIPGFSSHVIGSQNLDMAAAADFDGDNRIELLVPDQAMTAFGAIRRTSEGAELAWILPLGASLRTNLALVRIGDGDVYLGAGLANNTLRLWVP